MTTHIHSDRYRFQTVELPFGEVSRAFPAQCIGWRACPCYLGLGVPIYLLCKEILPHSRLCKGKMWSNWGMDWIKLVCVIMSSNKLVGSIAKKLMETPFVICKPPFHVHCFSGLIVFKSSPRWWKDEWMKWSFPLKNGQTQPDQSSQWNGEEDRNIFNIRKGAPYTYSTAYLLLIKSCIGPYS